MKKAFDQTVRDLKREVNKKVLKVPGIEQKILDATSNEPWGPHGSLLADIAQATRNYHEYQMIMNVIWKRINDTGKNWRHVYKALTVLDYLVAHGSERVIDEIKEHAYQISTLSDFQYIDSSGRDQGNNVRRKSQSLVALVNDKERIQEARQKAAANRDKYRSTFSTGRPGSYGGYGDRYDDDRYASRDEDRYGNGKEREWGYGDDDKYGRGRDSYGGEGDRYGRYADERYGRDDDYQYGSRNRSLSRDRSLDDDDRSSRSGGGRADNLPNDERQLDRRLSEQSVGAPPNYEEVAKDAQNHVQEDRNESDFTAAAPKASSPSAPRASTSEGMNQTSSPFAPAASSPFTNQSSGHAPAGVSASTNDNDNGFDEFDPRGMASVAPPAAGSHEMDLFGSASASDPIYSLALVPLTTTNSGTEADLPANSSFATDFVVASSASAVFGQAGENPFGDPPFKAAQENFSNQHENFPPVSSFNSISSGGAEILAPAAPNFETTTSFDFDGSLGGVIYNPVSDGQQSSFASPAILTSEAPVTQPNNISGMLAPQTGFTASVTLQESRVATTDVRGNPLVQSGPPAIFASQATQFTAQEARPIAPTNPQTTQLNLLSQPGLQAPPMEVTASTSSLTPVKAVSSKDKFETKSTVWADTLNRGLVNLNISGAKINPHADIGIDFDSINRKERRKEEKKVSAAPISTTTMGKAMGSGSGIGRTGANTLTRPPNPTMGMGMGMGMMGGGGMGMGMMGGGGMGMGMMGNGGMGMGGYGGGINQPMGMGMPPRPPMGAPMGGTGMPGVRYNPMMGMGNYGSQQPYGGGYR
ncbi:ENTH [Musa troglodytarum]|uniref:ENTH n=1 Tax=Musa troglodytarum TaxID=320322 RepID=A0A9E7EEX5_9LILI|nr:ENTH [Musa troglodytarum]URD75117.1 ENTH [Musa troglodytarum]URD75118.1 ENTH [Musa troglodytarum]URD75119.1 ENTH [Musa troglodytarum]